MARTRVSVVVAALAVTAAVLSLVEPSAGQMTPTCDGVAATIVGTEANDVLIGTDSRDVMVGLGGNDVMRGLGGDDLMCGDNGRDRMFGGLGNDELHGGKKNDIVKGDAGRDVLFGNQGVDRLFGGGGADELVGGSGTRDRLFGKGGFDACADPQRTSLTNTCEHLEIPGRTFTDPFEGALAAGWGWLFEDPDRWSLTDVPGTLQIVVQDAPHNVLIRPVGDGPFRTTTTVRFQPWSDFQIAGLVVSGDDFGDRLLLGRAFCSACGGDGVYLDHIENNGFVDNQVSLLGGQREIHLSLIFDGRTATAYIGNDGSTWSSMGSVVPDFVITRAGLLAAQARTRSAIAQFEFFSLTHL